MIIFSWVMEHDQGGIGGRERAGLDARPGGSLESVSRELREKSSL